VCWISLRALRPLAGWGGVLQCRHGSTRRPARSAAAPGGSTVTTLMANSYAIVTLHDLVRNGFATAHRENIGAGRRVVGVTRLRVTAAGRRALT
jgi:hypothetical protein